MSVRLSVSKLVDRVKYKRPDSAHWECVKQKIFTSAQYFPIKCVGGPSVFMRTWLHRYANQHSAIYIVLLNAYEVVDVNG